MFTSVHVVSILQSCSAACASHTLLVTNLENILLLIQTLNSAERTKILDSMALSCHIKKLQHKPCCIGSLCYSIYFIIHMCKI